MNNICDHPRCKQAAGAKYHYHWGCWWPEGIEACPKHRDQHEERFRTPLISARLLADKGLLRVMKLTPGKGKWKIATEGPVYPKPHQPHPHAVVVLAYEEGRELPRSMVEAAGLIEPIEPSEPETPAVEDPLDADPYFG